jgi:hypothetical protein
LTSVIIDHDVIGWAYENMQKIKSQYTTINIIGKNNSPEELMNSNASDLTIAKYCLENNCDLITADKKSYLDWFNLELYTNRIDKLIISKYDYWIGGQRPIIRIQIQKNADSNDIVNETRNDNIIIGKSLINTPSRIQNKLILMLNKSLNKFPELNDKKIILGITYANDGNAVMDYEKDAFTIRLNPRRVTYFTIGHELTHFLQFLQLVPSGEKASDIFTLAKSRLFLDEPPSYLRIPKRLQDYWEENSSTIHTLSKDALEYRKENRNYIKWFENKLINLVNNRSYSHIVS